MSDNEKLPPTAFAQTIAQALAERHTTTTQTVKLASPSTQALAGKLIVSEVAVPRDPDQTHKEWMDRVRDIAEDALKICLVLNDENYRDELLREALVEIRNGGAS